MLKHVLQYLLITCAFVSIPFVLYFAIVAFGDVATEGQQEAQVAPSPDSRLQPTPDLPPTPLVSELAQMPADAESSDDPMILDLDEIGAAFWLKRQDNGMYDGVANLSWIADGVDETEADPVAALIELSLDEPETAILYIETPWFNDGLTEDEAWAFLGLTYIDYFAGDTSTQTSRLPWVVDGIDESESWAISSLPDIFDESPRSRQHAHIKALVQGWDQR